MYKKSLIFLTVMLYMVFTMGMVFTEEGQASQSFKHIEITVYHGDTLWDIASQFKTNEEDTREVLNRIYQFNDLRGKAIKPGDKIMVPVQKHSGDIRVAGI